MKKELREYLSSIGKKGGSVSSEAKARAARENGKLGGKPKKLSESVDLFGIPLTEDAFDRKTAIKGLKDLQEPIAEHLLLLFTSKPESENVRGWEKELNAWRMLLVRRNSGKTGRNNFTRQQLVKSLWIEPLGLPRDREIRLRQLAQEKGLKLPVDVSDDGAFRAFVMRFIDSILSDETFNKI